MSRTDVQEQMTALSQKQLDMASFPEQVVHHIEQDLAEVISRLDRQVQLQWPWQFCSTCPVWRVPLSLIGS